MIYLNSKRLFLDFLKKNGIYYKWRKNLVPTNNIFFFYDVSSYKAVFENNCREGINRCCGWASTKEGKPFWAYYDAIWKMSYFEGYHICNRAAADKYNKNWRATKPITNLGLY